MSLIWRPVQGALFRKYVVLFAAVMGMALIANNLVNIWFTYGEYHDDSRPLPEGAGRLGRLEDQPIHQGDRRSARLDDAPVLGDAGHRATRARWPAGCCARFRRSPSWPCSTNEGASNCASRARPMDRVGSGTDFSTEDRFKAALANKVYYGPVYFRRETEPYMTLAVAGPRRDAGVSVAEVNLKHIWDVVNQIRVGQKGPRLRRRCAGTADRPSRDQPCAAQYRSLAARPGEIGPRRVWKGELDEPPQIALDMRRRARAGGISPRRPRSTGSCSSSCPRTRPTRRSMPRSCAPSSFWWPV